MTLRSSMLAVLLLTAACGGKDPEEPSDSDSTPDTPAWITDSPQDRLLASMSFPGLEAELIQGPPPSPNGAPFVLTALGGAPGTTSIGPGQAFEIAFNYAEVFVNPIDVVIYFDGGSGYFRVRIDLEEGQGQVRIPAEMQDDVCENLAEIIHAIQCNEALQNAGDVADYLVMNLELRCDGSEAPPTTGGGTTGGGTEEPPTTTDTGETGTPPVTGEVTETAFRSEYATLYCAMEAECNPTFYELYGDGIYHCESVVSWQNEGCVYDPIQGAACLAELDAAVPCVDYAGPWRDTCKRVWSYCP